MDPVRNPYVPGAGTAPQVLAGRSDLLELTRTALLRLASGRPAQSPILVGLRGVGKTVFLVKITDLVEGEGFIPVSIECSEDRTFAAQIAPGLRKTLLSLDRIESAKEVVRKTVGIFKAFIGGLGVQVGEMTMTYAPSAGVADSGDIEADLPEMLVEIGKAALAANKVIVLIIDELQVLQPEEFSALIMAIHKVTQKGLPVAFVGAGLPQVLALAGNAKSYAERLFIYSEIGALNEEDAIAAIVEPAQAEDVKFEPDAVSEILRVTKRYPYFLQQWAHDAWNVATGEKITWRDVLDATEISTEKLDQSFFRVRYDRCEPSEKAYMRALAEVGDGSCKTADVAEVLGVRVETVAEIRASLIKKGMIYAPSLHDICFTVPLFDAFMRRVLPEVPQLP